LQVIEVLCDQNRFACPQHFADGPGCQRPPECFAECVRQAYAIFNVQILCSRINQHYCARLTLVHSGDAVDNEMQRLFVLIAGFQDPERFSEILQAGFFTCCHGSPHSFVLYFILKTISIAGNSLSVSSPKKTKRRYRKRVSCLVTPFENERQLAPQHTELAAGSCEGMDMAFTPDLRLHSMVFTRPAKPAASR
jgi:hypothetical protein